MAIRSREVFRGKHRRRNIITGILFVVAALLIGAIVLFYSLQKYLVYGQDGVSLELPFLATPAVTDETGQTVGGPVGDFDLVINDPDYSAIPATAGEGLDDLRALFVPAAKISDEGLDEYKALMSAYGANALLLEVKPESGQLVYFSASATAQSYQLSGSYDLAAATSKLKAEGVYLAAELSCCVDNLLATRNSLAALKNAYGGVFTDETGMWLDPYSGVAREYITDLANELIGMGFDEIVLKNISAPPTEEPLAYTAEISFEPSALSAVSGFSRSVTTALEDSGAVVSAVLTPATLHDGLSVQTGQDIELFFKLFDRVCGAADSVWQYELDRDNTASHITLGDAAKRYLPMISYAPESATSWIVVVPEE